MRSLPYVWSNRPFSSQCPVRFAIELMSRSRARDTHADLDSMTIWYADEALAIPQVVLALDRLSRRDIDPWSTVAEQVRAKIIPDDGKFIEGLFRAWAMLAQKALGGAKRSDDPLFWKVSTRASSSSKRVLMPVLGLGINYGYKAICSNSSSTCSTPTLIDPHLPPRVSSGASSPLHLVPVRSIAKSGNPTLNHRHCNLE